MAQAKKPTNKKASKKTTQKKPSAMRRLLESDLKQVDGAGCYCCLTNQKQK